MDQVWHSEGSSWLPKRCDIFHRERLLGDLDASLLRLEQVPKTRNNLNDIRMLSKLNSHHSWLRKTVFWNHTSYGISHRRFISVDISIKVSLRVLPGNKDMERLIIVWLPWRVKMDLGFKSDRYWNWNRTYHLLGNTETWQVHRNCSWSVDHQLVIWVCGSQHNEDSELVVSAGIRDGEGDLRRWGCSLNKMFINYLETCMILQQRPIVPSEYWQRNTQKRK